MSPIFLSLTLIHFSFFFLFEVGINCKLFSSYVWCLNGLFHFSMLHNNNNGIYLRRVPTLSQCPLWKQFFTSVFFLSEVTHNQQRHKQTLKGKKTKKKKNKCKHKHTTQKHISYQISTITMQGTSVQSSSQSESRWLRIHATDLAHKELACDGKHVHTHAHPRTHMHAHTHTKHQTHTPHERSLSLQWSHVQAKRLVLV